MDETGALVGLLRWVDKYRVVLAVVIGLTVITLAAWVFTAHDGDNYDPNRYGPPSPAQTTLVVKRNEVG